MDPNPLVIDETPAGVWDARRLAAVEAYAAWVAARATPGTAIAAP